MNYSCIFLWCFLLLFLFLVQERRVFGIRCIYVHVSPSLQAKVFTLLPRGRGQRKHLGLNTNLAKEYGSGHYLLLQTLSNRNIDIRCYQPCKRMLHIGLVHVQTLNVLQTLQENVTQAFAAGNSFRSLSIASASFRDGMVSTANMSTPASTKAATWGRCQSINSCLNNHFIFSSTSYKLCLFGVVTVEIDSPEKTICPQTGTRG